jgi:hypothetical protein
VLIEISTNSNVYGYLGRKVFFNEEGNNIPNEWHWANTLNKHLKKLLDTYQFLTRLTPISLH